MIGNEVVSIPHFLVPDKNVVVWWIQNNFASPNAIVVELFQVQCG